MLTYDATEYWQQQYAEISRNSAVAETRDLKIGPESQKKPDSYSWKATAAYWLMVAFGAPTISFFVAGMVYAGDHHHGFFVPFQWSWWAIALMPTWFSLIVLLGRGYIWRAFSRDVMAVNGFVIGSTIVRALDHWAWPSAMWGAAVIGAVLFALLPENVKMRLPWYGSALAARSNEFAMFVGVSTGRLLKKNHVAAIAPEQPVTLRLRDFVRSLIIIGEVGTGKTLAAMIGIGLQCIAQGAGVMAMDGKGALYRILHSIARAFGRNVVIVGPNRRGVDTLRGFSPAAVGRLIAQAFEKTGQSGDGDNAYFTNSVRNRCTNIAGILQFFPDEYNYESLRKFWFDKPYHDDLLRRAQELEDRLWTDDPQRARELRSFVTYEEQEWPTYQGETKSNVESTMSTLLGAFRDPAIQDAFCRGGDDNVDPRMLLDGGVILVDIDLDKYPGARRSHPVDVERAVFQSRQEPQADLLRASGRCGLPAAARATHRRVSKGRKRERWRVDGHHSRVQHLRRRRHANPLSRARIVPRQRGEVCGAGCQFRPEDLLPHHRSTNARVRRRNVRICRSCKDIRHSRLGQHRHGR